MTCLRQQLCLKVKNAFENKVVAISDLAVKISYIPNNISYILGGDGHDLIQIFQQRMFLFLGGTLSYLTENLLLPVFTKLKSNWIGKKIVAMAVLVCSYLSCKK